MSFHRVYFWGCEVAKGKPSKWIPRDESVTEDEDQFLRHTLFVENACLASAAKVGDTNIIEATGIDINGDKIKHPIIRLASGSCEQAILHLSFTSEVSFKLVSGSGPVHLTGSHEVVLNDENDDLDSSFDEEMDEETDMNTTANTVTDTSDMQTPDNIPAKKRQKRMASLDNGHPSKKPKTEVDLNDSSDSDDDDWINAKESDDDEDEEDLDEDKDDSSLDEDDESEASPVIMKKTKKLKEESMKISTPKQTPKQLQPKLSAKKSTPVVVKPKVKTPKAEVDKATPKSLKKEKKTHDKPLNIDEMKSVLIKTPGLPKKEDKFMNYCKQRFKITDVYMLNDLWAHVKADK